MGTEGLVLQTYHILSLFLAEDLETFRGIQEQEVGLIKGIPETLLQQLHEVKMIAMLGFVGVRSSTSRLFGDVEGFRSEA